MIGNEQENTPPCPENRPGGFRGLVKAVVIIAAVLAAYAAGTVQRAARTAVASFAPTSPDAAAAAKTVEVTFSAPLDPASVTPGSLFLSPAAEGAAALDADGKRLVFTLDKPLSPATAYRIGLSPNLRDRGGSPVTGQGTELAFCTPELKVESAEAAAFDINAGFTLSLRFNNAVAPEALAKHLKIYAPQTGNADKRTALPFHVLSRTGKSARVRLPSKEHAKVTLALPAGFTGVDGPRGLDTDYTAELDLLALSPKNGGAVRFLGMEFTGADSDRVRVRMNTPLEAARAPEFVSITPDAAPTFAYDHSGLEILGKFQPGVRYEITLKKGFPAGAVGALDHDITRSLWCDARASRLSFPYSGVYTPGGLLKLPLETVNLSTVELHAYKMFANNLVGYLLDNSRGDFRPNLLRSLGEEKITINGTANQKTETLIDLRKICKDGGSATGVYFLRAVNPVDRWQDGETLAVVSDLGLSLRLGKESALCWAASLQTADPLANVSVKIYSNKRQEIAAAATDERGLARLALPRLPEGEYPAVVIAEKDGDLNFLSLAADRLARDWEVTGGREIPNGYSVFSTTERGVYRPGETVKIGAFVRDARTCRNAPELWLELSVSRPDGKEFLRKKIRADASGRALGEIALPDNAPAGHYHCRWTLPESKEILGTDNFQTADFIPPTIKLEAAAPEDAHDWPVKITARARHLFGAPAAGLKAVARAVYRRGVFTPKSAEWKAYSFRNVDSRAESRESLEAVLDAKGECVFVFARPGGQTPYGAFNAEFEIEAQENGGRALNERLTRTLYRGDAFIGVKLPESVKAGAFTKLPLAALCPAEKTESLLAGVRPFRAVLYRVTYANVLRRNGSGRLTYDWVRSETRESELTGEITAGRGELVINPRAAGEYRLAVTVNGCAEFSADIYAAGDGENRMRHAPDQIVLTAAKKKFRPGETAEFTLQAPFAGTALLCVENDGVQKAWVEKLHAGNNRIEVPVDAAWRPNAYLTAALVRPVQAEENWQPHRASGEAVLTLDCEEQKLAVAVKLPAELRPGAPAAPEVKVTDAAGQPVKGAAVVLAAVDAGVLSLTDFAPRSPFAFFYGKRGLNVISADMYSNLAPEFSRWKAAAAAAPGGGADAYGKIGRRLNPIKAKRVKTAVLYAGTLLTDENGEARAEFTLPEYSGELRFMAFAAADDRFGLGDVSAPVQSSILFRASWPRFAAPGDVFTVPVTVFNRTQEARDIVPELELKGDGLRLLNPLPQKVTAPALGETAFALTVKAGNPGAAAAALRIRSGDDQYRESVELAVRPAAGRTHYSGGLTVKAGAVEKITVPGEFFPGTEECRLVFSGNALAPAAAAVRRLLDYPHGCLEQTVSRMLPLLVAPDLAAALDKDRPDAPTYGKEEIQNLIDRGCQRLEMLQTHENGGLRMWPHADNNEYAWGSIYAADFLNQAHQAGYRVPEGLRRGLLNYLENHLGEWVTARNGDKRHFRLPEAAYAVAVLAAADKTPYSWLTRLEETVREIRAAQNEPLPVSAAANLARTYLTLGRPELARQLWREMPDVLDGRMEDGPLASLTGDTALVLSALLDLRLDAPEIPQAAHSLARAVAQGGTSTFENAQALLALAKYARRQNIDPQGKVKVTFADGKTREFSAAAFTVIDNVKPGETVTVSVSGTAPAQIAWHCSGAARADAAPEEDKGVSLRREIRDAAGNPVTAFRSGELYYVTLTAHAGRPLNNSVITEMLPAGLEIENQDLRSSAKLPAAANGKTGLQFYPSHVEARDDRLLLFVDLPAAPCSYTYLARAVTPGTYALPAAEFENMYDPETRSRYGAGKITVK